MIAKGKILIVGEGRNIYSSGYKVYNQDEILGLVRDRKYALFSQFSLIRRLLRAEITGAYHLHGGRMLISAKKGLFINSSDDGGFQKVFAIPRGSKPLNICILPNGHIFWGEYFQNMDKEAVNIYASTDNGLTWRVVYTFPKGNINHVHGLFYDPYTQRIWVLTGDRGEECIIGYTDDEFKTFHVVLRGGQEYRSCQLFFYKDFIVYATDSQYMENEIRKIDRNTFEITTLARIQGSAIKGGQTRNVAYLSTTVEPSEVNNDRFSHIWITKDGQNWEDVMRAEKDCLPAIFQFGTFEFPQKAYDNGKLWFSGRALKMFDNKSSYIEI
jgi:hypothetical protein